MENEEEHAFDEHDIEEHQPRKGRGPVKKIKSNEKRAIKFNSHGQPVGAKFVRFSNQVGVITRNLVPITYENWHRVPKKTKDLVWAQVKDTYNIENDNAKKEMVKQCGFVWKRWKTNLRKNFMDTGVPPYNEYTSIEKKQWKEFVAKENTPEKIEKRELGRQNALKKKLPPRLGPKGYRGWEEVWNEEAKQNGLSTDAHRIYDPRSRRWVLARLEKNGNNVKYVPIELSPYLDELLQLDSQMQEGSWKPESGSDLLSTVIGPEHPGRLRAVGPIGFRKGLENYKETKRRTSLKEMQKVQDGLISTIENMKENYENMKEHYDKQLDLIRNQVGVGRPEMEAEAGVSPGIRKSSCGSTKADPFEGIQVPTKCSLLVPNIDRDVICGKGMVYSTGSGVVHGVPIREGYVKVHVDHVEKKYATLDIPVSVPSAEIYELIQAHKTFIQWPKKAITFRETGTNIPTPPVSRNERASKASGSRKSFGSVPTHHSISPQEKTKQLVEIVATRPHFVQAFYDRWMKRNDPTSGLTFAVDGTIFGKKEVFHVPLVAEEVMRILTNKELDVSIISLFAMIIHEEMIVHPSGNKCAFLNPHLVDARSCAENPQAVESYLKEATKRGRDIEVFLLPYNQGCHWSLLIFLKNEGHGFILDSFKRSKTWKDYAITNIINRCLDVDWEMAVVQQQTSTWECGYYVMRWMYEFVIFQQHNFPLTVPWRQSLPYAQKLLDAIVGVWTNGISIPT